MSNKNFTVMVVPRWFTITPETIKALAYVYKYHVRDMPAFFKPDALNINEALRAKHRLEGIVQSCAVLDKTNWHFIQDSKKFSCVNPMGYFTGWTAVDFATDGNEYATTTAVDTVTGKQYMVTGIRPKGAKDYTPIDIEIPFTANAQESEEVTAFARRFVETIFPDAGPRPVMVGDKQVGVMTIDGNLTITDPEFRAELEQPSTAYSVRSYGAPGDGEDGTTGTVIWGAPKGLPADSPLFQASVESIREALSNEIKWDNRELGADPEFAVKVELKDHDDMMRVFRDYQARSGRQVDYSLASELLPVAEVTLTPEVFEQYNRDEVNNNAEMLKRMKEFMGEIGAELVLPSALAGGKMSDEEKEALEWHEKTHRYLHMLMTEKDIIFSMEDLGGLAERDFDTYVFPAETLETYELTQEDVDKIRAMGVVEPEHDYNRGRETSKGGWYYPNGIPRPYTKL